MTDISIFIWIGALTMLLLFMALFGLIIYVLRTSYKERSQLIDILAQYATLLQDMATRLQTLAEIIADVEKRMERMEFSRTSTSSANVFTVGEGARVGQGAQGAGMEQKR